MTDPSPVLQFQEIWASAITIYNQDTKRDDLQERGLAADSPDALFVILDKEMNRFKEYQKRGERVRHAIRSVLELVNLSSGAIGDSLATAFPPAKVIFVAVCVLLKAAKDVSAHYDMIIDMFEKLKGFMGRLDVYVQHEITDNLKRVIVGILAQVLVVLGVATKWMKQSRLVQCWKVLCGKNTEVSDAMGTLRILTSQEIPMVTAVILATTTTTSQNMQASEDGALREKIRLWLKPPDPTTNYNTAIEARQVGTGAWFIQSQDFVDWTTTPGSFMWICGIPGNGKTIICATIIEALKRQADSSVALAYFYFNFNDSKKLVYRNMLHSLVFQLLGRCSGPLRDLYKRTDNGSQQPTLDELLEVLKKSIGFFSHAFIVIDGLDECIGPERTNVLKFLAEIQSWNLQPLHILVASRLEQEIKEKMESLPGACHVDLHGATSRIDQDIHRFLIAQLENDPHLNKWEAKEKVSIRNALVARADGMFQWVRCQLDSLRHCVTNNDLNTALNTLPKSLDETYERILRNIPDDHQEKIHRILQFLCFSERPMMLDELAEVVTVTINSDGTAHYDSRNRMRDPSDVLTICGSLVSLSPGPEDVSSLRYNKWRPDFPHETLAARIARLSHFSVKEYLTSNRIRSGEASEYSVNVELANRSIAMTCLAYLMRFDTDGLDEKRMKRDEDMALALYAAHRWLSHFKQLGPDAQLSLQGLAQELFRLPPQGHFLNWISIYDLDGQPQWYRGLKYIPSPLYYSCNAGLLGISEWLLTEGAEVNGPGGQLGNALQAASERGHEAVVQLLLERGANVNARREFDDSALHAASRYGHEAIVRLLLDRGAEVNAPGEYNESALWAACSDGHEAVVRLLLDRGADINALGRFGGNVLQVAVGHGYKAIARLLLDRGVDVNAPRGLHGDALEMASARGHEYFVQLLLGRGAEVNKPGGYALQAACESGKEATVRLLLDRGAEVNAHGDFYGNTLQAASRGGHETVARLLLDRGAEVNAQGGSDGNALYAASHHGHEAVVRLLLDRGAEVNAQGGPDGNALHAASHRDHEAVVRLLLNRGAEVNARGRVHKNALWAALTPIDRGRAVYRKCVSSKEVVKVLWDAGARLYTMPSKAHSAEYIAQLADMDSIVLKGDAEVSQPQSSKRKSWPLSLKA